MDQGYTILLYEQINGHEVRHAVNVDMLRYCQQTVRGHIEIVRPQFMERPLIMLVNDEGLLRNMKINPAASYLYGTHEHGSPIVGPAMIMKEIMTDDGPDIGFLTKQEAAAIADQLWIAHQWARIFKLGVTEENDANDN